MKLLKNTNLVILVFLFLLSLVAGGAKLFEQPQEIKFFADAGVGREWIIPMGAMQMLGACVALLDRMKHIGIAIMGACFLLSTIMIFMTGNSLLAVFSLLPVILSVVLLVRLRGVEAPDDRG